jgi:PPOX class probable F420-dependent enzyme
MAMRSTLYVWAIEATAGVDSAWTRTVADGFLADGHIAAGLPESHSIGYRLEVDADLVTRRMVVEVRLADRDLRVDVRNDAGRWSVDGLERPDLEGALDVDLAGCPLTNVMPIRRHDLVRQPGSQELLMAFIDVPELRVVANRQRYTHIRRLGDGGAVVRYESGDFRSDLTVDEDGMVLEYPHLGRRVLPGRIERPIPSARRDRTRASPDGEAIDARDRAFIAERRTATLATLSAEGRPRLVPICFVIGSDESKAGRLVLWSPLDAKPKRSTDPLRLARVRDVTARPDVALLFDRWSEDWSELAWVRAAGRAELVAAEDDGRAHRAAVEALRDKYVQYRAQPIEVLPMIRIEISGTTRWQATRGASLS